MKKLLTIGLLLAACGCDIPLQSERQQDKLKRDTEYLDKYLDCAWIDRYKACFCFVGPRYEDGLLTYVPDKVCGR